MKGRGERRAGAAILLFLLAVPLVAQQPLSPFQEQKARALLRTQLPCLGCHELDGDGGRIGPSLTDVGTRRSAAYIRGMVQDPQSVVLAAAMPMTPMPAANRELVIRFLSRSARATAGDALPAATPSPSAPSAARRRVPPRPPPAARTLYATWCASCHGHNGSGDGPNAKSLPVPPAAHDDAARMRERADDSLFDTIAGGGRVMGRSPRMPAFGATLSREEIRSLVAYIRALCRCEGPAWSRDGRGG